MMITIAKTYRTCLELFLKQPGVLYSNELCLTAVGGLIGSIDTVIVSVTHPHAWNTALGDGTLELVGGTCHFRCRKTYLPINTEE